MPRTSFFKTNNLECPLRTTPRIPIEVGCQKFRTPMDAQSEEAEHIVVDDVAEDSDEEHECRVCRGPAEEG